jgi:hypothetical protein
MRHVLLEYAYVFCVIQNRTGGKFFKAEVLGGRVENVMFLDRAKNNHSKYQKIGEMQNEATHL